MRAKRFLGVLDADRTAGKSYLDHFQKFAVASTSQKSDIRSRYGANEWSVRGAIVLPRRVGDIV